MTNPSKEEVDASKERLECVLGVGALAHKMGDDVRTILTALATAEEDSKRLTFMQINQLDASVALLPARRDRRVGYLVSTTNGDQLGLNITLRDAIDDARNDPYDDSEAAE